MDLQQAGDQAVGLEEVLRPPRPGQREGVDADAALVPGPGHRGLEEHGADADAAGTGLDVEVVEHGELALAGDERVPDVDLVDEAEEDLGARLLQVEPDEGLVVAVPALIEEPDLAALLGAALGLEGPGELDEPR